MAVGWRSPLVIENGAEEVNETSQKKTEKERHATSRKSHTRRPRCCSDSEQPVAARSPVAMGVVLATSLYCGVKAGIQGYQQLRRHNLRTLVRVVAPVLDKMGVQYFADFGTLLGMYREKDIILYDNDADLVIVNPDWDSLLDGLRERLPRSYRVFYIVPSEDRSIKWIRIMTGVGIMDLYGGFVDPPKAATNLIADSSSTCTEQATAIDCVEQQQRQQQAAASSVLGPMLLIPQGHGDLCDVPASLIFPLSVMKFRGTPVSVPADVPGVLRYRYGDTFMIPRYMDKGRDCIEQGKFYAKLLGALGKAGLRV